MPSTRFLVIVAFCSGLASAAAAAPPIANVTAPRTSCVAPCAIFFDARSSSDADLSPYQENVDLLYSWDFGDPGSGTWNEGARARSSVPHSRNRDSGFVAGHVYETPGSYTATLTLTDGAATDTDTILVSIQNPNTVWAATNTVCIGASSRPTAGSGGCPSGAATAQNPDFDDALNDHGCLNASRRCLFRRGDTFTNSQTNIYTSGGPGMVGAFGSGAKPRVNSAAGAHVFRFGQGNSDFRVVDLQIYGANQAGLSGGAALAIDGQGVPIHRFLGLRLDIRHFDDQIHFRGTNGAYFPGVNTPDEIAIVDCTVLDGPGLGGNDVFVMWERSLFLGNRVGESSTAPTASASTCCARSGPTGWSMPTTRWAC
jgi:hypothetical protein